MEVLIALGIVAGLAAAAYLKGTDSRSSDLDRAQGWWPGQRQA
ncbi:MAG TPA: hypothetical protein VF134_01515 [Candidatus Dormibacteraeota bacterium]